MTLFAVKLELNEAEYYVKYDSLDACIRDPGLKSLFNEGLINKCVLFREGQRIAGMPFATWDRFKDVLISNASFILRTM